MKIHVLLPLLALFSCQSMPEPLDAMPPTDSAPTYLDAPSVDAPLADAALLDAGPGCIQEHRFTLDGPLDPPGAIAGPIGRVVHNEYGGVGVDDGFVDTGEVFTVTWSVPTHLVSYAVTWMEDGPDADTVPGEHGWEVETGTGTLVLGRGDLYETGNTALVPDARELRVIPVDGDRMAVAMIRWCTPIPECRCEDIQPVQP